MPRLTYWMIQDFIEGVRRDFYLPNPQVITHEDIVAALGNSLISTTRRDKRHEYIFVSGRRHVDVEWDSALPTHLFWDPFFTDMRPGVVELEVRLSGDFYGGAPTRDLAILLARHFWWELPQRIYVQTPSWWDMDEDALRAYVPMFGEKLGWRKPEPCSAAEIALLMLAEFGSMPTFGKVGPIKGGWQFSPSKTRDFSFEVPSRDFAFLRWDSALYPEPQVSVTELDPAELVLEGFEVQVDAVGLRSLSRRTRWGLVKHTFTASGEYGFVDAEGNQVTFIDLPGGSGKITAFLGKVFLVQQRTPHHAPGQEKKEKRKNDYR